MSVDKLHVPNLSIITTPLEKEGGDNNGYSDDADTAPLSTPSPAAGSVLLCTPNYDNDNGSSIKRLEAFEFTPSPQGVDTEFFKRTPSSDSSKSPGLSKVLKEQLVTVDDDEIVVSSTSVSLPELEDANAMAESISSTNDENVCVVTPKSNGDAVAEFNSASSPFGFTSPRNVASSESVQHKMLTQSVNAIASPIHAEDYMPQLHVGPERTVLFHTESLGIKISRHTDGYVRVLSVIPYRSYTNDEKVREGEIHQGDVVREVSDVNLRMPIDSAVWKLTIGLIKMAPRPLKFVVAREMYSQEEEEDEERVDAVETESDTTNTIQAGQSEPSNNTDTTQPVMDPRFGPTREVHFLESCLGVKLHHTPEGYVQILSVTPYQPLPGSPMARTGDIRAGDVVLEVGGVWNLRDPLDQDRWGALVQFIRETRRPLCMVLADGQSLENVLPKEKKEMEVDEKCDEQDAAAGKSLESAQALSSESCADMTNNDIVGQDNDCNASEDLGNNKQEGSEACEAEPVEIDCNKDEGGERLESDECVEDGDVNQIEESQVCNNEQTVDQSDENDHKDVEEKEKKLEDNYVISKLDQQNEDVYVLKEQQSMDSLGEELLEMNFD